MRPSFFPRETNVFSAFELSPGRNVALRVVPMAVFTGVLVRGFRAIALTHGDEMGALYVAATLAVGAVLLYGMLTLHLANFPVRRWPWRVLAFALVESAAEMVVSAGLVAAALEPIGTTGRAGWHDLPSMALATFGVRLVALALFAAVLAGVVQLVRRLLPRHAAHHSPPTA